MPATFLNAYRNSDTSKARQIQAQKLRQQPIEAPSKEQLMHWMEIHSHTPKNSALHRLAGDKVQDIFVRSLQAEPLSSFTKPATLLHEILKDGNDLQQKKIKHATLVMVAKRHVKAVVQNPAASMKHHRSFIDATETSFDMLLNHAGRKEDGTRSKNIANAQIGHYFQSAINSVEGFKNTSLNMLKQLITLTGNAEKHDLKPTVPADFFMPAYIAEITTNQATGDILARQHVRNAVDFAPTAGGTKNYLTQFGRILSKNIGKLDKRRRTNNNQSEYASTYDTTLAVFATNVFSALNKRVQDKKPLPTAPSLHLMERTLKLTGDALALNTGKDAVHAVNSLRTIRHMKNTADAVTTVPGTSLERRLANISQRIQTLESHITDKIDEHYKEPTALEIYEQSKFDTLHKFPGFVPPPKPGFFDRLVIKAKNFTARYIA